MHPSHYSVPYSLLTSSKEDVFIHKKGKSKNKARPKASKYLRKVKNLKSKVLNSKGLSVELSTADRNFKNLK